MKKFLILIFFIFSNFIFAQTKLGLKVAPLISTNRATNDSRNVNDNNAKLRASFGLIVDKPISDFYYLSSGLVFMPKYISFRTNALTVEKYNIQYLQIPVTLKLFTNEIKPDTKIYFQVGGGIEIKIYEENKDTDNFRVEKFMPLDLSMILGTGVEFKAGINTILFSGISYHRGLVNIISDAVTNYENLEIRNSILSVDFGVKF